MIQHRLKTEVVQERKGSRIFMSDALRFCPVHWVNSEGKGRGGEGVKEEENIILRDHEEGRLFYNNNLLINLMLCRSKPQL